VIKLTRLNGEVFYLNPHQIERMEERPDTVITMNSQSQYIVKDKVEDLISFIIEYRKKIGFSSQE